MNEIVKAKKSSLAEKQRRQITFGVVFLSLLLVFSVITKIFPSHSVNSQQVAMPFEPHFFKITLSSFDGTDSVEDITFSICLDPTLSFLGKGIFTNESNPAIYDVSVIAKNGESTSTAPSQQINKTAHLSQSAPFHPIISRAAAEYQVDPALVRAIIFAESGYNPTAVSKRGAMGLMQLMPTTAKAMGVEDCFNPEHNIFGGVKYFKKLFNQFNGDVKLALAAYNAGSRKVRECNGVPPFRATEHYIQKVMKYYNIYKSQQTESVGLS